MLTAGTSPRQCVPHTMMTIAILADIHLILGTRCSGMRKPENVPAVVAVLITWTADTSPPRRELERDDQKRARTIRRERTAKTAKAEWTAKYPEAHKAMANEDAEDEAQRQADASVTDFYNN